MERDYDRFARDGLPEDIEDYLLQEYQLDVTAEYAGYAIPNPWGKASGQLSMTSRQVEDDVRAGLGFIVLKTVIAEDATGGQSMRAWAIPESRMTTERIVGTSGETGWTVSWKGRGWWQSFDEYLQLLRDARRIAGTSGTLIVPSCKFHLPQPGERDWNVREYDFTVRKLLEAWRDGPASDAIGTAEWDSPMPLEKDFSPTLAGSDRASAQATILEWLRRVPELVHAAAEKADSSEPERRRAREIPRVSTEPGNGGSGICLGLKLFNALFDDGFQWEMLRAIHEPEADSPQRPAFIVYGNRLFDPAREYDGQRGIAYGGPDLSDRNLRVLSHFQREAAAGNVRQPVLPLSATGNIGSGKMALEYALRGASSFQMHTLFQLPASEYRMQRGNKTEKALHALYFHPEDGFVVWMHHLAAARDLPMTPVQFRDVVAERGMGDGG